MQERSKENHMSKRKIAILGSGQAALTAATQLTDPRNPEAANIEVDIYQFGWRLGGKGASGRNMDPAKGYRIEEHGLHNWFGFYDNAFRQIQDVYSELNRAPDAPLGTWEQAFIAEWQAIFVENINGRQSYWEISNPNNLETPGSGELLLPLWEYALMAIEAVADIHLKLDMEKVPPVPAPPQFAALLAASSKLGVKVGAAPTPLLVLLKAAHALGKLVFPGYVAGDKATPLEKPSHVDTQEHHGFMQWAEGIVEEVVEDVAQGVEDVIETIGDTAIDLFVALLEAVRDIAYELLKSHFSNDDARRAWIMTNFGVSIIVGCIKDNVLSQGFGAIDEYNFRDWVASHAYDDDEMTLNSVIMHAVYDSSFAYVGGNQCIPEGHTFPPYAQYEAGTALAGMVRAALTYKGSFGYKFAASTADTCYGPMYEILKRRGVRFHFFSRVLEIIPGATLTDPIQKIKMYRQAELAPGVDEYHPLFDVKGLPCWPSEPLWDQLKDGDKLREEGVNFEHLSPDMQGEREFTLTHGTDYDDVVLGISLAMLPSLAPKLFELSEDWRNMKDKILTVRTMALQLWSRDTSYQMGWPNLGQPMTSFSYGDKANYLNVWGDLSNLVERENWSSEAVAWGHPRSAQETDRSYPQNIAYFTTSMPDDDGVSPFEPYQDYKKAYSSVRGFAVSMMNQGLSHVWSKAQASSPEGGFDWGLLIDNSANPPSGESRIDSQFIRGNVLPTERYVLSVPGSGKFRLQSNDPNRFPNLYLCGDWMWCGMNSGCMEAATMAGMLCSNFATQYPERKDIIGVDFGR